MTEPAPDVPPTTVAEAATVMPSGLKLQPYERGASGYLVQMHDTRGRLMYDGRGYPVLVQPNQQAAGVNVTVGVRLLLAVAVVMMVGAVLTGVISAVELHHVSVSVAPTSDSSYP